MNAIVRGGDSPFLFTDEHQEFRRQLRDFFGRYSSSVAVRGLIESRDGFDEALWRRMADQLGLQGLIVPEQFGGSGYSFVELAIALEEMGRVLLCGPFFSTLTATLALLSVDDPLASERFLPQIASGDLTATLGLANGAGEWGDIDGVQAEETATGWMLRGQKSFVLDGHSAGLILLPARTTAGPSLFAVEADLPGLKTTPMRPLDPTRKLATLDLDSTPAALIGENGGGQGALNRTFDLAAVALAVEQVGAAQRVLEMSVGYALDRVQFGRPIGSFQAIKHTCAEMLVDVELARSVAYAAAWSSADELAVNAPLAKAHCSDALVTVATDNIQVHGGTGFTWEHDAHLYFRRAKASEQFLGDPAYHRERYAQRIGL